MKLLLLPLLALAATSPGLDRLSAFPAPLAAAFRDADRSIEKIGICLGPEAAYVSTELDSLNQRFSTLLSDAAMTWGNRNVFEESVLHDETDVDCASQDISALFDAGNIAVESLEAAIKDHLAVFDQGVWVGPISLCGREAVKTEITKDRFADIDVLAVTLEGPAIAELSNLTEASVGHRLAIRADGEVVVAPTVNEPLLGGQFQIAGPDRADLERIASLLSRCAGSPPN